MPYKDKEKQKEYMKTYKLKNKIKLQEYTKQYRKDNADRIKVYEESRKDYLKEYKKNWKLNKKDGYHRVYLLEDYNYVGITDSIYNRFSVHKSAGRDCKNYRILHKTKDRSEALELEALLHDIGYEGKQDIWN